MSEVATNHEHAEHASHPKHLAHHFETEQQQFESGKLGMWLFLATEVLLFGGLFCAYAIYRASHPETFIFAHQYLDWKLGGLNTIVLIGSSFTMAWGVRCAQLGQQRLLAIMLTITLLCGGAFMVVKYVEYKAKFEHDLLWGTSFKPDAHYLESHSHESGEPLERENVPVLGAPAVPASQLAPVVSGDEAAMNPAAPTPNTVPTSDNPGGATHAAPVAGQTAAEPHAGQDEDTSAHEPRVPDYTHIFFGIYFTMTGLHGLHVLLGMAAIGWILFRSLRGDFSSAYFTPVDLVGLYWHLVDLIWIFLFPLLYLIA